MPDEPLDELGQSRADTGLVCIAFKNEGFYRGFSTSMNNRHKKPSGMGTKAFTALQVPHVDDVPFATDGKQKLLAYPVRLWSDDDDITDHPNITELTKEEFDAISIPNEGP